MDVHPQRPAVADDQDGVADGVQRRLELGAVEVIPEDDEVDAVAVAAVDVLGRREARGRLLRDLDLGGHLAAQARDEPREDQNEAVGPGVDHPRLGEHLELAGRAVDRLLAGERHDLEHLGEQLVLAVLPVAGIEPAALLRDPCQVLGRRMGHRPDDRQHRPLRRVADRLVGGVGRPGEGGADEDRVDQLAGPRRELLGGPADDLAEDHARSCPARPSAPRGRPRGRSRCGPPPPRPRPRSGRARRGPRASSAPCCRPCRRRRPGTRSGR